MSLYTSYLPFLARFRRLCLFAVMVATVFAAAAMDSVFMKYMPDIHGVVRARWEMDTRHGESRFQVRNARLSAGGDVAERFHYYMQADFCDRGSIRMLDAWASADVTDGLNVRVGQFRMPFGYESFKGPATYLFANRSFIGRYMNNVRAVGAQVAYRIPRIPVRLEAGVFNPTSITDHDKWVRTYAYAGKATAEVGDWTLSTGFESLEPDSVRINLCNFAAQWQRGRWLLMAEYMYKHYTNGRHTPSHGYLVQGDFRAPLRHGIFNRISWQMRMEGMTDHSGGKRDDSGELVTDQGLRNRLTLGTTVSHIRSRRLHVDFRVNYELNFYGHNTVIDNSTADRLVAEMVVSF